MLNIVPEKRTVATQTTKVLDNNLLLERKEELKKRKSELFFATEEIKKMKEELERQNTQISYLESVLGRTRKMLKNKKLEQKLVEKKVEDEFNTV